MTRKREVLASEDISDLPPPTHRHPMSGEPIWDQHAVRALLSKLRAPADEPPGCPTYVCQAAQADGVLCANDECDRASGVRPASAPVAGEAQIIGYVPPIYLEMRRRGMPVNSKIQHSPGDDATAPLYAAPQASAEYERGHDDGWAAGWDQALKQPQASEAVRELPEAEQRALIGGYFAEDWAKEAAAGLLHDHARALAALSAQPGAQKTGGSDAN